MDGSQCADEYTQEQLLEIVMLFFLALLSASAQEVTARSLLPQLKTRGATERVAISETDVVLLVSSGSGEDRIGVLMRQGAASDPVWRTTIQAPAMKRMDQNLSWHHLAWSSGRLLLFSSNGLELQLHEVDPETGAVEGPRTLGEHAPRPFPTSLLGLPAAQVPMIASPGQQWFLVNEKRDNDGALHLRAFDANLQSRSIIVDGEGSCTEGTTSIDDRGTVLFTAQKVDGLCIAEYPREGAPRVVSLAMEGVEDVWSISTEDGTFVAAQADPGLQQELSLIRLQDGAVRYHTTIDSTLLREALFAREDADLWPPRALYRVALLEGTGDGGLLVGLQSTMKTVTTTRTIPMSNGYPRTTRKSTRYSATDMVVLALDADGGLRWTQQLPTATTSNRQDDVIFQHRVTDDALELVHCRESYLFLYRTFSDLNLYHQEVSLVDGSRSPERALFPDYGTSQGFLPSWSTPLGADGWFVVSSASPAHPFGQTVYLSNHIRLDESPAETFPPPAPAAESSTDDADYQLGRSLGEMPTINAHWDDRLRGLGLGAAGAIGGLWLSEQGYGALGTTMLIGGTLSAGLIGGAPEAGSWTLASPAFQAGYIETDRRQARWRALRWGAVGLVSVSLAATLPDA